MWRQPTSVWAVFIYWASCHGKNDDQKSITRGQRGRKRSFSGKIRRGKIAISGALWGERERERERGGFIKTHWFPRTKTPLYITHQPPLSSFPRLLLSLSIIHALFSATSWQVRKITENEEQRKRPIKQKRKERGAINTFFIYFPFFFFVLVLFWCWGVFDLWVLSASEGLESFDYNKPFLLK